MSTSREGFHWLDYLVFSVMLLVSCGIGVYHAWKAKSQNQANYLMGNRQMKWWAVALSMMVSYYSAISQIGKPAEIYLYGIQFSVGAIGIILCITFVMATFVPLLYNLKLTSSYEYLELRFQSRAVRLVGSLTIIVSQIIYCGFATYIPAISLEAVTGFPVWTSILLVGVIATFYTMLGGLKAVVWADVFQFVIMVAGMVVILIYGFQQVGGWNEMWKINKTNGRINFLNFDPDPTVRMSFWSMVIGSLFTWLQYYSVNQACVQRVLLLNLLSLVALDLIVYVTGLLMYSYFSQCDPLNHPDPQQRLSSSNQLVPLFVMEVVTWPGLPGVFLASIFSGSFSSVSSCLNAMAVQTWEDFLKWKYSYLSDRTKTNVLKLTVLFYGVVSVALAFLVTQFTGSLVQVCISFRDTSSSPLVGMFILGAFFRRTNWLGAIIGSCVGFVLPMWMSIGSFLAVPGRPPLKTSVAECAWNGTSALNTTCTLNVLPQPVQGFDRFYTVSFLWFPVIGTFTTVIVGWAASLISAPFIEAVGPDHIEDKLVVCSLDYLAYKQNNRAEQKDAENGDELREFTTQPQVCFSC